MRSTYFLDDGIPLKCKFVIVVQVCELFLGHLHSTRARDVVHTTFLEELVEHITLIIKSSRTDFSAIIEQIHTEKLSFAILVVPGFDG
jgi:hypothetical protein